MMVVDDNGKSTRTVVDGGDGFSTTNVEEGCA